MSRDPRRPTVAVVGLGLIGGSLARALTRASYRVIGVDRAPVLRSARAARAVAATAPTLEEAAAVAHIVVLAAPPAANLLLLRRLAGLGVATANGLVVTDVGSVKGPIAQAALDLRLPHFVGGHPMAGTEGSGFAASTADLFRGRPWALTPSRDRHALRQVRALVRAVGGRPLEVAPDVHDRAMAFLSHLPQVVAWALADTARRDPVAGRWMGRLAGPGFQDMTRLAGSPAALWRDILDQNRHEMARALRAFRRALGREGKR